MKIEKLNKESALILLPDYIKKLEEDIKNTENLLVKKILKQRLEEMKNNYEKIKKL